MQKIKNNKILWWLGLVAGAALGAYMFFKESCCDSVKLEFVLVFLIGLIAFVLSVALVVKRFLSIRTYLRDPTLSRPTSVFENRKDNRMEK